MIINPIFCMNSYLMYRTIIQKNFAFSSSLPTWYANNAQLRQAISTSDELGEFLCKSIQKAAQEGPIALMLSSGMDSAILASYMPKGSTAYTLRCVANSAIDETKQANFFAQINELKHEVVNIYWHDFEKYSLPLMRQKGYPIHSIEVQIYKAALLAKAAGIKTLVFGETADIIYGGHSKLLSRDWTKDQFVERFCFVDPRKVLKQSLWIEDPILPHVDKNGYVNVHSFLNAFEYDVSLTFYKNACKLAGINFLAPYSGTILNGPLDIARIRSGESKYIIRSLFKKIYPSCSLPPKTPLPRPMSEWLQNWNGPLHEAFITGCLDEFSGDAKWYIYALNEFLNKLLK